MVYADLRWWIHKVDFQKVLDLETSTIIPCKVGPLDLGNGILKKFIPVGHLNITKNVTNKVKDVPENAS